MNFTDLHEPDYIRPDETEQPGCRNRRKKSSNKRRRRKRSERSRGCTGCRNRRRKSKSGRDTSTNKNFSRQSDNMCLADSCSRSFTSSVRMNVHILLPSQCQKRRQRQMHPPFRMLPICSLCLCWFSQSKTNCIELSNKTKRIEQQTINQQTKNPPKE